MSEQVFDYQWCEQLAGSAARLDLARTNPYLRRNARWDTGWRTLDSYLCYAIVSGTCTAAIGDKPEFALSQDTFICFPPHMRLRIHGATTTKPITCYRFRFYANLKHHPTQLLIAEQLHQYLPEIETIIGEALDPTAEGHSCRTSGLLAGLFVHVLRVNDAKATRSSGTFSPTQRRQLTEWLSQHLQKRPQQRVDTTQLAKIVNLSPDYFSRVFRRSFSMAPRSWLVQQRLIHIAEALTTSDDSIDSIAKQFGYGNTSQMVAQFRKEYQLTPRQYRQRHHFN